MLSSRRYECDGKNVSDDRAHCHRYREALNLARWIARLTMAARSTP